MPKSRLNKLACNGKAGAVCLGLFALLCAGIIAFSAVQIADIQTERTAARQEYDRLREQAPIGQAESVAEAESADLLHLAEINPDFVGWLEIPGTEISYPVAQGTDNYKYLHTTFAGEQNEAGAIFMDCDVAEQFEAQHIILYGHNRKDGTMFGGLSQYHDAAYLAGHPTIEITLPDGTALTYRIFAARTSDVDDVAYRATLPMKAILGHLRRRWERPRTQATCSPFQPAPTAGMIWSAP